MHHESMYLVQFSPKLNKTKFNFIYKLREENSKNYKDREISDFVQAWGQYFSCK